MATKPSGDRAFLAGLLLIITLGLTFPEWGVAGERLDKIRLVHSNRGGSQAIAAVVQEAGIFKKYGLDLEMIFIAGTLSIKSLLAGEVQMALAAGPAAALARLAGGDIVVIMGLLNTMDHVLFGDKRIARIQDLRGGETWGVHFWCPGRRQCPLRLKEIWPAAGSGRNDPSIRWTASPYRRSAIWVGPCHAASTSTHS